MTAARAVSTYAADHAVPDWFRHEDHNLLFAMRTSTREILPHIYAPDVIYYAAFYCLTVQSAFIL
jgi:hypothetical protein